LITGNALDSGADSSDKNPASSAAHCTGIEGRVALQNKVQYKSKYKMLNTGLEGEKKNIKMMCQA
jgi:hypothetical protein